MHLCIYITTGTHREIFNIWNITLTWTSSSIHFIKPHRGFLAISKCFEVMFGYSCCLFHSLRVILQLAMGCLIATRSLPPSSAQVRRIDEEQKLSVICDYLDNFISHRLCVVVFVFSCDGSSKLCSVFTSPQFLLGFCIVHGDCGGRSITVGSAIRKSLWYII